MNKQKAVCDIAIVGGGMVGVTLALMLTKNLPNLTVTLIDDESLIPSARPFQPSFDARSTAISAQSVDIFSALDLWPAMAAHATPIAKVQVTEQGGLGATSFSREENDGALLGYVVENVWLGRQLLANLADARQITALGCEKVSKLIPRAQGAELALGSGNSLQAALVIVADGALSSLRGHLGIDAEIFDYQQQAVICNVEYEQSHAGTAYERFTPDGPLALLPMGDTLDARQSALVWTQPSSAAESLLALDESDFLVALQKAFGHRLGKFLRASARHAYPLQRIIAKEQARRGLVLMGNAAHFLHPVAGQGFNLALRDCDALVRVLAHANAAGHKLGDVLTLESYVLNQEQDQWLTAGLSHGFNQAFTDSRQSVRILRNMGLIGLNTFFPAKKILFNQMMGKGFQFTLRREF